MAKITNYFAQGTHAGQTEEVWIVSPVSLDVGKGQFTEFSDYCGSFNGHIDVDFLSYHIHTDLKMHVELLDKDPAAKSGPASINLVTNSFSGDDQNARYEVKGSALEFNCVIGGSQQKVTIYPLTVTVLFVSHQETEIDIGENKIHLAPK